MEKGITRELMACRCAQEIKEGMYVNLGIGLPTQVSNYLPADQEVFLHSENGILNYGNIVEEEPDHEFINAGGQPVSMKPGASLFHTADAFAMMRRKILDLTILGGFQVSEKGDVASSFTKEDILPGIGGAADLAFGAKRVMVLMGHTERDGTPRIVRECSLPLTGKGVVSAIVTNLAYIKVTPEGLLLEEVAPGLSPDEVQKATEPRLIIAPGLKEMEI